MQEELGARASCDAVSWEGLGSDREGDGHQPPTMERRSWLKRSGLLMGTLAVGSPLALIAPSRVWALALKVLNDAEAQTLIAFARVLYPHEKLPDAVYALLVKDLDRDCVKDGSKKALLKKGLPMLDRGVAGADDRSFLQASLASRRARVEALADTPFFQLVRSQCITSLYNNAMAFAAFGYPGPAWPHGGYLIRGFQDLKWLPDPPDDASPDPQLTQDVRPEARNLMPNEATIALDRRQDLPLSATDGHDEVKPIAWVKRVAMVQGGAS